MIRTEDLIKQSGIIEYLEERLKYYEKNIKNKNLTTTHRRGLLFVADELKYIKKHFEDIANNEEHKLSKETINDLKYYLANGYGLLFYGYDGFENIPMNKTILIKCIKLETWDGKSYLDYELAKREDLTKMIKMGVRYKIEDLLNNYEEEI